MQEQGLQDVPGRRREELGQPTAAAALWSRGRCEAQAQMLCKSPTPPPDLKEIQGVDASKRARKASGLRIQSQQKD